MKRGRGKNGGSEKGFFPILSRENIFFADTKAKKSEKMCWKNKRRKKEEEKKGNLEMEIVL